MRYAWIVLALATCALGSAPAAEERAGLVATTARPPPRTLDRQAAELAWRSWLQSPESGNQNAPPRRITTKSLFITPLVCPKGQRLDRDGCVQVVTVNKDEHERILLEQLNALFTSEPSGDVLYDYGDSEPLQLSIPIGFEPQASPLQSNAAPELQDNYVKIDKKDKDKPDAVLTIEAELEKLKHQHAAELELSKLQQYSLSPNNETEKHIDSPSVLNNLLPHADKPKRDNSLNVETTTTDLPYADEGQKEVVYGHVNYDPYLNRLVYETTETSYLETEATTPYEDVTSTENELRTTTDMDDENINAKEQQIIADNKTDLQISENNKNLTKTNQDKENGHELQKDVDKTKLNPENEYSDIGQAIKLISRYAEVTTDDNFSKEQKRLPGTDENILGTRTKLQHRRNKLRPSENNEDPVAIHLKAEIDNLDKVPLYIKSDAYYRYPWVAQSPTPPPGYPFRHLQDYWSGKIQNGLYDSPRENPRRHHHSFPHGYYRNDASYYPPVLTGFSNSHSLYPPQHLRPHRIIQHHADPVGLYNKNHDLYSLLGLRHWFSSEGAAKR